MKIPALSGLLPRLIVLAALFLGRSVAEGQVVADFILPETVCVNYPLNITNLTTGGSTYYWNFCSGNANMDPIGANMGNPGSLLSVPTYITLVRDGDECFSFVSCQGVGVVRYSHGGGFSNNPLSWTNLGTFGLISMNQEGIQVKNDNGQWVGFVCSDTRLVRLNFGTSLWNTPAASVVGNIPPQSMLHGLVIEKEGDNWIGLATCSVGNKIIRMNFGADLMNDPVFTDLGNLAGFDGPGAVCVLYENDAWYAMLISGHNTLARLNFGTSLLNAPTGHDLGNPGGLDFAVGLTILRDCGVTTGYWVNYLSDGQLGKLVFDGGITGTVTGQILGNLGDLSMPHSFSELFRQEDTLYTYITNRGSGTLSRLVFPPCNNASIASSTQFNPPVITYDQPGTYNVRLLVNEGLPDQASVCKTIVVIPEPCGITAGFTVPDTICLGSPVTITNTSSGGSTYYWNFCSGSAIADPVGTNIGNPGNLLNVPVYLALAKAGTSCYSFITNQGSRSVVRYGHGSSFDNLPVSADDLGSFGTLSDSLLGIKICQDQGNWFGFAANNNRLVRLQFGTSPANTPVAAVLGPYPMLNSAHCIDILNENGNWIGLLTCSWGNKIVRLNFGNSLGNAPVLTDLGSPGGINLPGPFRFIRENGIWYALIVNLGDNTFTRLTFGSSLLNNPFAENIGTVCPTISPGGIAIIRDCGQTAGFQLNYSPASADLIWRLRFPSGIAGPVTGTTLGNIGNLNRPAHFSELFRTGDSLFMYATNRQDYTLTKFRFAPCNNASVPSSVLFNPPVYTYDTTGTFNINLVVNEGLPDQVNICKSIVVLERPDTLLIDTTLCYGDSCFAQGKWQTTAGIYHDTIFIAAGCDSIIITDLSFTPRIPVDLGPDTMWCDATPFLLRTGVMDAGYLWQDGSTDSTYLVSQPGRYWVIVTKYDCPARDSILISECTSPVWFPNAFTPNGDGINDIYHPVGEGVVKFSMYLFNRWGEQIFSTSAFSMGWDGAVRGQAAPDGVYFFVATYEMADKPGEAYHANGSVTLLR